MKLQVASDLRHELAPRGSALANPLTVAEGVDLLVLAGDVDVGVNGVNRYAATPVPVVYVHGNHEAFGYGYPAIVDEMKAVAEHTSVRVLQNDEWIYHGVRFLGASMWTDYFGYPLSLSDALDAGRDRADDVRKIGPSDGRAFQPQNVPEHQQKSP